MNYVMSRGIVVIFQHLNTATLKLLSINKVIFVKLHKFFL